jgi:hypothetical protein
MTKLTAPRILAATLILAGVAGCGGGSGAKSLKVSGEVRLNPLTLNTDQFLAGGECSGVQQYADLRAGGQVVVTDSAGATVATGTLQAGSLPKTRPAGCYFPFTVTGVPAGKGFYSITVAGVKTNHQYSESDLSSPVSIDVGFSGS